MDWSNKTPIEEMRFGTEWKPTIGDVCPLHPWPESDFKYVPPEQLPDGYKGDEIEGAAALVRWKARMAEIPTEEAITKWKEIHADGTARVRQLLTTCGVKIGDDIRVLGCTGCASFGLTIDDIKFLRLGLAGSGEGLPCFVPPNRYCLAHEITGGLQDGQKACYPECVDKVARPLTPEEIAHDKLVDAARYAEGERGAHSLLHGRTMPKGWEEGESKPSPEALLQAVDDLREEGGIDDIVATGGRMGAPSWKCPEHKTTNWACRYCVAQAVVEGNLVPVYVLGVTSPPDMTTDPPTAGGFAVTDECEGKNVAKEIADEDANSADAVKLYVRVATYTRKLSRD